MAGLASLFGAASGGTAGTAGATGAGLGGGTGAATSAGLGTAAGANLANGAAASGAGAASTGLGSAGGSALSTPTFGSAFNSQIGTGLAQALTNKLMQNDSSQSQQKMPNVSQDNGDQGNLLNSLVKNLSSNPDSKFNFLNKKNPNTGAQ